MHNESASRIRDEPIQRNQDEPAINETLNKVSEITLAFWIIKIAATALGETGGDTITMTLNWGYLAGTAHREKVSPLALLGRDDSR
jgi:uncharacterized membrane-anchored protein